MVESFLQSCGVPRKGITTPWELLDSGLEKRFGGWMKIVVDLVKTYLSWC